MVLLITVTNMRVYPSKSFQVYGSYTTDYKRKELADKTLANGVLFTKFTTFSRPIFSHVATVLCLVQTVQNTGKSSCQITNPSTAFVPNSYYQEYLPYSSCSTGVFSCKVFFLVEILFKYNSGQRVVQLYSGIAIETHDF